MSDQPIESVIKRLEKFTSATEANELRMRDTTALIAAYRDRVPPAGAERQAQWLRDVVRMRFGADLADVYDAVSVVLSAYNAAKAEIKGLRLDREPLKADYVRMYQLCVGYQAALAAADELAEEVESHWTDIPRLVVLTDHYLAARSGKGEGSKP